MPYYIDKQFSWEDVKVLGAKTTATIVANILLWTFRPLLVPLLMQK